MKYKEFVDSFAPVLEYYKTELSEVVLMLYFENLKSFNKAEFNKAVAYILTNRKYSNMPSIAEFIEAINGNIDQKAFKAFESLRIAMREYGQYASVCFKDKTIMRVVDNMGGWVEIFNTPDNEWKWFEKEFIAKYKAFYGQGYFKTHLVGYAEQQNSYNGNNDNDRIHFIGFDNKQSMLLKNFAKEKNQFTNTKFNELMKQKRINNAS